MRGQARSAVATAGGLILVCLGVVDAHAGGVMLPGIGPIATSRAGAFVATADDPSALGTNPAGLAKGTGTQILIGANFIDFSLEYQRSGTYDAVTGVDLPYEGQPFAKVEDESKPQIGIGPFQAIPLVAVSTDLGLGVPGLRFGAGVFAPNAYPARDIESDYVLDQNDSSIPPPPNRYDVTEEDAAVVSPSIAVAYRAMDKLDIGARFTWGFGHIESTNYVWGVSNDPEYVQNDSVFSIEGTDYFIPSFAIGALYRPTPSIELGAQWTSQSNINAKGTGKTIIGAEVQEGTMGIVNRTDEEARCAKGGTPEELKACVEVGLPMVATVGARFIVRDPDGAERADVELDVQWENHSAVSDYKVVVDAKPISGPDLEDVFIRHGFQDTVSIRLGGSYRQPVGSGKLIFRGGAAYDTAAAKDDWERLDLDGSARTTLALGVGYRAGRFQVDLGGGAVLAGTRNIGAGCNPSDDEGCDGTGNETPGPSRPAPDPAQPAQGEFAQEQSPFNDGEYKSGYLLFMLGVQTWF
jgi:long-subunit fatty acid transport protein